MQETAVMEEESKILSSVENGVGRLIFNNPQRRNAMSLEMWETTSRTLEAFDQNPGVPTFQNLKVNVPVLSKPFTTMKSPPKHHGFCRELPNRRSP